MTKLSFARLISMTCWLSLFSVGTSSLAQSTPKQVTLTTSPSLARVIPYEAEATTTQQPVKLTLQAIDSNGRPLTNVRMKVKLFTPAANPFLATDFPIVEGTQLLDLQADVPTGKLEFQQMFPIRGNYQLQITTTQLGVTGGDTSEQNMTLTIPENSVKYQNYAVLALLLAAAGLGGGWVIGAKQVIKDGEIAPQPVRLLLSGASLVAIAALLYVNISAEMARSGMSEPTSHMTGKEHEHGTSAEHSQDSIPASSSISQGIKLAITGDEHATVGKLANFQIKAIDLNTSQPVAGIVNIQTVNTENADKWTAFGYQGAMNGRLTWDSGLFDGSGHQVNVEFTPTSVTGQKMLPMRVSQPVEVEGVAPPLSIRLISLGYMTGIMAIAFLLGFWIHRRHDRFAPGSNG
jgi:hypothetical protein